MRFEFVIFELEDLKSSISGNAILILQIFYISESKNRLTHSEGHSLKISE